MDDPGQYTAINRDAWNAVAERRRASCQPPEFFAAGGSTLEPEETAAMGPVRGLRLLNLLCSSGNDALSWAALGASVVGVDISDVAIRIATEQATAAGLDAEFIAADVYDLPAHLQQENFDRVYSTAGIICWMPDLAEWGRIVARALRPGGMLLLDEHHPIWELTTLAGAGVRIDGDYFGRSTPNAPLTETTPEHSVHAGGEPLQLDGISFIWPLGDVITALADAGLRVRQVTERPSVEMYASDPTVRSAAELDVAGRLPAAYLLVATKD
ncbi:MAG TPA: class I SAM-dependent methyltransferase [Mycobacteriales bacterium]|nr:class I SAM-dependent methyltransferase [Mycobacteriales bacterium]